MIEDLDTLSFLSLIERPTYMCAFGGFEHPEKSISGNSSGTRNPANTFFRYQTRLSRDHESARFRKSSSPDGEKDEKREAYRAERNRIFIQNSPMTMLNVLQGHILRS